MYDSLIALQEKASAFFSDYEKKYRQHMQCASGCSHCCIGGLSIFTWEAELIIQWFASLTKEEKTQLIKQWQTQEESNFTDVKGKSCEACSFLINDRCSIYPRRPIICRTQGMGLKWNDNGKALRDCCPLNFTTGESQLEDELNLDVLNKMIAQAQILFTSDSKSSIAYLQEQQRIELSELRDFLIQSNSN